MSASRSKQPPLAASQGEQQKSSNYILKTLKRITFPEIKFSELQLQTKIASGGYGEVWKGTYKNNQVAIKKFHENNIHHFKEEQRIVAMLAGAIKNSHYLVKPIGYSQDVYSQEKINVIVSEYMQGTDVARLMYNNQKLFIQHRLRIMYSIIKGLKELHDKNILHRDLKLDNILYNTQNKMAKLCDFGRSTQLKGKDDWLNANERLYPLQYTAPEEWLEWRSGKASEIYKLGLILWEMLELKIYLHGLSSNAKLDILEEQFNRNLMPVKIPKDTFPALANLIENCLQQNYKDRPKIDEVLQQFIQLLPGALAYYNDVDFLQELIGSYEIDFSITCGDLTPLTWAIERNNLEMVEFLLSKKEHCQGILAPNKNGRHCSAKTAKMLKTLAECGLSFIEGNQQELQNTFISYLTLEKMQDAKILLELGLDVNAKNKMGQTPLECAIQSRSTKAVEFLLNHDVDITILNPMGRTPFSEALATNDIKLIELFFKYEKYKPLLNTPNANGTTGFSSSLRTETVLLLAEQSFLTNNADTRALNNSLSQTLRVNHDTYRVLIPALLKLGADINCKTDQGDTLFLNLIKTEPFTEKTKLMVKYLISINIDVYAKDADGNTPLVWAVKNTKYELINLFLELNIYSDDAKRESLAQTWNIFIRHKINNSLMQASNKPTAEPTKTFSIFNFFSSAVDPRTSTPVRNINNEGNNVMDPARRR